MYIRIAFCFLLIITWKFFKFGLKKLSLQNSVTYKYVVERALQIPNLLKIRLKYVKPQPFNDLNCNLDIKL